MRYIKITLGICLIISVIIIISCENMIEPNQDIKYGEKAEFQYATANEVAVTIKCEDDDGNCYANRYFEIRRNDKLISSGQTNELGEFTPDILIPDYLTNLTIQTKTGTHDAIIQDGKLIFTANPTQENPLLMMTVMA